MSPTATDDPGPAGPPDPPFWRKYNDQYELPIGTAVAVLAHVLIVAAVVFLFFGWMSPHRSRGPVKMIAFGDDETGQGSPAGGDGEVRQIGGAVEPAPGEKPPDLADVRPELADLLRGGVAKDVPIPENMDRAFRDLDDALRKRLLERPKGDGRGTGPGSTGSDSTRARGLRWVLRFNTRSGQDYLNQLKALKAVVMIPVPPDNKRMLIVRDPGNPRTDEVATDADIAAQAETIQFQDARKESVEAVRGALRLDFTPAAMWAFFPRELEAEMARMETAYQNKRSDQVRETVFQVIVVGGKAQLRVVSQTLR